MRTLNWSRLRADKRQLDLRGHVTTAADAENQFLENMPGEIQEVLQWHAGAQSRVSPSQSMAKFAGRFLGAMYEDGAVLPKNLQPLLRRYSPWSYCNIGPVPEALVLG